MPISREERDKRFARVQESARESLEQARLARQARGISEDLYRKRRQRGLEDFQRFGITCRAVECEDHHNEPHSDEMKAKIIKYLYSQDLRLSKITAWVDETECIEEPDEKTAFMLSELKKLLGEENG